MPLNPHPQTWVSARYQKLRPGLVLISAIPTPDRSPEDHPDAVAIEPEGPADPWLGEATSLSQLTPREALGNPGIAQFFLHYIRVIAPWYDLSDATSTFSTIVTTHALEAPVLFRAIIALSSSHCFKIMGTSHGIAFAFYAACIEDLLRALDNSPDIPGDYLAAACLLQLYEILNGNLLFFCLLHKRKMSRCVGS